jgi:hypothetical protein
MAQLIGRSPAMIISDCVSRRGGDKMTTTRKSGDQTSTKQKTNNAISGTMLSSWSRQQKFAVIASFTILGLLLAASACSKQSPKPALAGASSQVSGTATPTAPQMGAGASTLTALAATAPAKKVARKRPANVTYSDANSGVSFLYPRKAVLTSGDNAEPELAAVGDVPMNFIQPGGVAVATVAFPDSWYPGTDFASAFFNVNVNGNLSEEECSHFAFVDTRNADGEPVDAEKVKIGSSEMETTSDFSASVVKQVETRYYHSFENGSCYEYVLGLGTESFATEEGIEHVDRDDVFAKLEKILATVKINPKVDPNKIDTEKIDAGKVNPVEPEHAAEPGASVVTGGKE